MRWCIAILLPAWFWTGFAAAAEPEIWTTTGSDGHVRDFLLWPGGVAVSVSGGKHGDGRGLRGFWHESGKLRLVMMESGASAKIDTDRSVITEFDGGRSVSKRAENRPAAAIGAASARWLGVWIWSRAGAAGTRYVSLVSDGSALATPGTHGRWVRVPRGIRVEWHDGAIDLLQFDEAGAALRSWPRGSLTRADRPQPTRPERVGTDGFRVMP